MRPYPEYGPRISPVGENLDNATPSITSPLHHVITTAELTTLTPPQANFGYAGPTYLIADSVFAWTTSGNIGGVQASTIIAGSAIGFVYDRNLGKWYPISNTK